MTDGEKMIWAAVFAKEYDIHNPPPGLVNDGAAWEKWETDRTVEAIECAGGAVQRVRESLATVREGFGAKSDTYKMLREMLKAAPLSAAKEER